jgi:hypothetical protein
MQLATPLRDPIHDNQATLKPCANGLTVAISNRGGSKRYSGHLGRNSQLKNWNCPVCIE